MKTMTEGTSAKVFQEFHRFLNQLQYDVLIGLHNYHVDPGTEHEWPTYKELASYMAEDKNNIQPRLNELRNKQLVMVNQKRLCSESSHNTSVSVFELVIKP